LVRLLPQPLSRRGSYSPGGRVGFNLPCLLESLDALGWVISTYPAASRLNSWLLRIQYTGTEDGCMPSQAALASIGQQGASSSLLQPGNDNPSPGRYTGLTLCVNQDLTPKDRSSSTSSPNGFRLPSTPSVATVLSHTRGMTSPSRPPSLRRTTMYRLRPPGFRH
jgi:hypothetical protein